MARVQITAEPELIHRQDESQGRWDVSNCPPERGVPYTNIVDREMLVPMDDDPVARCIRAHEVMHSKVSPGTHWPKWLERGWATERSMRVIEEARVNNLCHRVGIPVRKFLSDNKERGGAERIAQLGHWDDAVFSMVAMIETAGFDEFMKGIKKHKPKWVKPLQAIAKKIVKEFNKIPMEELSETGNFSYELYPAGFRHTERLSCWLDSIARLSSEEAEQQSSMTDSDEEAPISEKEVDSMTPSYGEYEGSDEPYSAAWGKLNVVMAELDKSFSGSLGRKRKAAQVGRNPRRIHRMLTDPERRIFDVKSRTKGGIILIDASGSMHFDESDIATIMQLAPGALVAMYAEDEDGSSGAPNLHIIAKNGKTVSEIPPRQTGNNVDLPALQWAASNRNSNATPIVWVSDGQVTATNGEVYSSLGVQCIDYCKKERIMVAEDINAAISIMGSLKSGRKPNWDWPPELKRMHREIRNRPLTR